MLFATTRRPSRQSDRRGSMTRRLLVPPIGMCLLLAACGGSASENSPSPTPSQTVAAADLVAVAKLTFPLFSQFGYYAVCGMSGDTSRCPYTPRLKARLAQGGALDTKNYVSLTVQDPDGLGVQISGIAKPGDALYKA